MSRDHTKLDVFHLADALVLDIYQATTRLPPEERYGLQSQIRRASVSVAANIVEGCSRETVRDYLHFLTTSVGSANEVSYLLSVATRLRFLDDEQGNGLSSRYTHLARSLNRLISAVRARDTSKRPPKS